MTTDAKDIPTLAMLRERRDEIIALAEKYGVLNVRVFGSVARGDAKAGSDIDLLVDFPPKFSLLKLSSLIQDLQDLVNYAVQVTSESHLRDELRPYIMRDVQPL